MKNITILKMAFVIFILILFFQKKLIANSSFNNSSPPCMVGNVDLGNQAEVDDWVAQWGGCTKIEGNLIVGKNSTFGDLTDVTDISGLLGLEEVTGLIIIQKTRLTSLTGLNNLHTVGGAFIKIGFNYYLENLDGLQNLSTTINLEIYDNYNLENLTGLDGLTTVTEEFLIERNQHLENLQALSNLNNANILSISEAGRIKNLEGLEGLSHLGDLSIDGNDSLISLQGLNNLETTGNIYFGSSNPVADDGNPLLHNLEGLDNLNYSEGISFYKTYFTSLIGLESLDSVENINFNYNAELVSFEGLNNLQNVGFNFLVRYNYALGDISALSNLKKVKGNFHLTQCNALEDLTGLGSLEQVLNFWVDENENLTSLSGLNSTTTFNGAFFLIRNNSLVDISALQGYSYFENLSILGNPLLENLNALSNVSYLESFDLRNNPLLTNLEGLENLNTIQNLFYLSGNEALENINSLRGLTHIGGYLKIENNSSLTNLQGLNNLQTIGGDLEINDNELLHELRGLNNLKTVGGYFRLVENPNLYKINSLFELQSIGAELLINENEILQNIDGIDKLTFIGDWFSVLNNPELSECSVHFICRRLINGGTINFNNNKEGCNDENEILENCGINTFIGKVAIDDNLNCELDQGEFSLQGWKVIATSADYDNVTFTNAQGEYIMNVDTGTFNINVISPSSIWQPCINNQSYEFSGNYDTINVDLVNQGLVDCPIMAVDMNSTPLRQCANATFFVDYCNFGTAVANDAYVDVYINDFLDIVGASLPYTLDGYIATFLLGDVEPGSCSNFTINMNVSCDVVFNQTVCATAWIYPDSICEIPSSAWVGADLFVGSFCGLDEIVFEIENAGTGDMQIPTEYRVFRNSIPHEVGTIQLLAGESQEITFPKDGATYRMEVDQVSNHPKITSPGATIEACPDDNNNFETGYALQFQVEDYDASFDRYCLQISASLDPNDKRGFPLGYGINKYIEENTPIDYYIRFQNTGNDTAFLVVILDTLPSYLDPNSIELKGASHDYTAEILENNIIEFRFENILLPDSTTNEIESNGFVSFKIDQRPDLPFGTEIINSAAIYFDYNEPVITENSVHQVGFETNTSIELINLCEGESYEGITYLEDTTLIDSLDFGVVIKVDETTINVIPPIQLIIDTIITIGDPYEGVIYQSDTTIQFPFIDQNGCDSIVTINILVNPVGINTLDKKPISVKIFPNPISDISYFEIINATFNFGNIEVFNSIGQQVRQANIYQNKFEFNKGQLSPGVYFYKIELEDQSILSGKFSIE